MKIRQRIFLFFVALVSVSAKQDRIRLKDVQTLTLYSDRWTTARRSAPVKQLNCIGGHCGRVSIDAVQCYNRGFDGNDVQWECKAEFPSNYKFGRLEVTCEGYDYPDDDYILTGSCGLEYTIADATKTSNSYFPSYFAKNEVDDGKSSGGSSMLTIVVVFVAAAALYFYLRPSDTNEQRNDAAGGNNRSWFNSNPSPPPPPGFRPDCYGSSGSSSSSNNQRASNGPGFFSGMAAGSFLGYLFGSNRDNGYNRRDYRQNSFWNDRYASGGGGYSSYGRSSPPSTARSETSSTSTGFATTKRR